MSFFALEFCSDRTSRAAGADVSAPGRAEKGEQFWHGRCEGWGKPCFFFVKCLIDEFIASKFMIRLIFQLQIRICVTNGLWRSFQWDCSVVPLVDFQVDEKHVTHVEQLWQLQKDSESTSQRLVEDGTKSHTNRSGFAEFFPSENAMGKKNPGVEKLPKCHWDTSYWDPSRDTGATSV